jgi:hypothetical protein
MIAATIILAIAANSYELLCTAGLPMVYTRVRQALINRKYITPEHNTKVQPMTSILARLL